MPGSSPPGSSHSSTKHEPKKKKKSWSLEAKNKKKSQPKSRQQIKAMLMAREKIKEEDVDAPPNSDAKDDSLRFFEHQKNTPEREEYVMKQPQIALKRQVKKKGNRRAETVRIVRKNKSRSETPKIMLSREEGGAPIDTTLFKERASANNSNANSPDNSERMREREAKRRRAAQEDRTQDRSIVDQSTRMDTDGDSTPLPLAREPEPESRPTTVIKRSTVEKSATRIVKTKQLTTVVPQKDQASVMATVRPSQPRTVRSNLGPSSSSSSVAIKPPSETSTQLALEPEPDLDRVRRQKEAAFMKRFLTALKLLPNTAPARPISPAPRSEDSPSDSSKRHPRGNFKHHNPHNARKPPPK